MTHEEQDKLLQEEMLGKRFNMLVVEAFAGKVKERNMWLCRCDCGKETTASTYDLRHGKKKSCGCQKYKGNRLKDITGERFGRLVVLGIGGKTEYGKLLWKCQCDCGNITLVTKEHLGKCTNSCGCIKSEKNRERLKTHGEAHTRLHDLWCSMRQRCTERGTEKNVYYDRGITVCDEWQDYTAFRDWALANGYDPKAKRGVTTIDRIDNDKGYSPDNCRFITQLENSRNKRNTKYVTVKGETLPLSVMAEKYGIEQALVRERINRGWDAEKAILTPARKGNYKRGKQK